MDWLKEILTKNEVGEEQVKKIIESVKSETPKYFVPKNDFNEKVTEINNLTTEKNTLTKQLEDLKKIDPTKLQEEITNLQKANKDLEDNGKKAISDVKRNSAIDLAIANSKTIDSKALKAHLNLDSITYDEKTGTISGFDEQVKTIREEKKYLFENAPTDGGMSQGSVPPKEKSVADEILENVRTK